jgi:hypothetical protein
MKTLLISLAILLSIHPYTLAQASVTRSTPYRVYYPKTHLTYPCDEVKWTTKGNYCYELINGKYKSHGIGTLQFFTGLYDANNVPMYTGDKVRTPHIPDSTITYGITTEYVGFYLAGVDGKAYPFKYLGNVDKSLWSLIIK